MRYLAKKGRLGENHRIHQGLDDREQYCGEYHQIAALDFEMRLLLMAVVIKADDEGFCCTGSGYINMAVFLFRSAPTSCSSARHPVFPYETLQSDLSCWTVSSGDFITV